MRIKYFVRPLLTYLCLIFFLSPAVAASSRPENCETRPYDHGKLWEVSKKGAPTSFIFGTMHSKDPRILYLPGIVMKAFNRSSQLIVETILNSKTIQDSRALMLAPHGQSLELAIGAERFLKLREIAGNYGISAPVLQRFKIWAAASILSQPPQSRSQQAAKLTLLDRELEKMAHQMKKPVFPLEKAIEQLGLFDALSKDAQLEFLDQAIKEYPDLDGELEKLTGHYLAGRTGWIFCEMEGSLKSLSPELNDFMTNKLIRHRNHTMTERMLSKLSTGSTFVAIGAMHLPGDEGVLSLLKKNGYEIRRRF